MNKEEKTATAVVAAILTLLVLASGTALGWPVWAWLPVCAIPGAAALLLAYKVWDKREQDRMRRQIFEEASSPEPEPETHQEVLTNLSLSSAVPDYRFLLSASVYWRPSSNAPGRTHGDPGALARNAIASRAGQVLANERPEEHSALTERLSAALAVPFAIPSARVDTWASNVTVALPEADRKRLHRLAEVRKEEEVWENERNHERNVREYLGDDVLSNPGRAVVWWLARHNDQEDAGLHRTVESIEVLRKLTSAAHATEVPEWKDSEPITPWPAQHPWGSPAGSMPDFTLRPSGDDGSAQSVFVVDGETPTKNEGTPAQWLLEYVEEAVADLEQEEQEMFVRRMSDLLNRHGQHEAATELQRRFGIGSYTAEEESPKSADDNEATNSSEEQDPSGPDEYGPV